jgi:hypothetical protein
MQVFPMEEIWVSPEEVRDAERVFPPAAAAAAATSTIAAAPAAGAAAAGAAPPAPPTAAGERTVMAWVSTAPANWATCHEFLTSGAGKGTVNAISIDNLYSYHPENGTLTRDQVRTTPLWSKKDWFTKTGSGRTWKKVEKIRRVSQGGATIALQQKLWASDFRLYPMIGYGGNVTGLHSLFAAPDAFIATLVGDAVAFGWAGVNIDFEPSTSMDDSDPRR